MPLAKKIVSRYLKRWSIEMLIKDEKQSLGLGDFHVRRYQAIFRHLRLVDVAYACLTHLGLMTQGAQGQKNTKNALRFASISRLKEQMRQILWRDQIQNVIKHTHEKAVIRRLEKLVA
jgi:SRSO17 transposase